MKGNSWIKGGGNEFKEMRRGRIRREKSDRLYVTKKEEEEK